MDKILLIGAGGHARSCVDVIESSGQFEIGGFIDKSNDSFEKNFQHSIIGTDNDLVELRSKYECALVVVGQIKSPNRRVKLFKTLKKLDFVLPVIISPKAHVSKKAQIGEGTIIMHGAIVNAYATIGKNCIINNKALIEHDAVIGDHCHISTGTIVNGEVIVGDKTFIGSGAVIRHDISIGSNCIIGAGEIIKVGISSKQIVS
tara:strand:- start:113 stop:721 length:609 start_codon:yes stop_codon:yes gene_type:complete